MGWLGLWRWGGVGVLCIDEVSSGDVLCSVVVLPRYEIYAVM